MNVRLNPLITTLKAFFMGSTEKDALSARKRYCQNDSICCWGGEPKNAACSDIGACGCEMPHHSKMAMYCTGGT